MFVENFPILFGLNSISYNVHSLLHVKDSIEQVGDPTGGSSYAFENKLQQIKKMVRKPTQILEQLFRCISEEKYISNSNKQDIVISENEESCNLRGLYLSGKSPNNICYVKGSIPIKIYNFCNDNGGSVCGQRFKNLRSFYYEPCYSAY